jgi:hypothetical protein
MQVDVRPPEVVSQQITDCAKLHIPVCKFLDCLAIAYKWPAQATQIEEITKADRTVDYPLNVLEDVVEQDASIHDMCGDQFGCIRHHLGSFIARHLSAPRTYHSHARAPKASVTVGICIRTFVTAENAAKFLYWFVSIRHRVTVRGRK